MRRVKAHRFARAAVFSILAATASALFDFDAFVVHQSGPIFWFAVLLLGITSVCALVASFFWFTEQPREVEVFEPSSTTHVIHVTHKDEA
jgi:hypothetical protein